MLSSISILNPNLRVRALHQWHAPYSDTATEKYLM